MTVVALGNFEDFQILVSDSIVKLSEHENDIAIREKLSYVRGTECWFSLLGDELIFNSTEYLGGWYFENKKVLDLHNRVHIEYILKTTEISLEARSNSNTEVILKKPSKIITIDRNNNSVWQISVDKSNDRYYLKKEKAYQIDVNSFGIFYSGDLIPSSGKINIEIDDARNFFLKAIDNIHAYKKSKNEALSYEFQNYFSSVIIPKDRKKEIITEYAFENLSDSLYGLFGGVENIKIINDKLKVWNPT